MKIEIDEKFLEEDVKVLGLSVRTYNALTRHGYGDSTIGYVKKLLEEDMLYRVRGLGELGEEEVKMSLMNFVEAHNNPSLKEDDNLLKQPLKCVFDIGDKELINLHNNGVWFVQDLLNLSENQLAEIIKYPTNLEKLIKQINIFVKQRKMNKLRQGEKTTNSKEIIIESQFDKNDLNINEIPEKYRKTYAIGAGVVAKQELEQNSRVGVSKKILTKSNVIADKPALPKVKISKQAITEMSDKQLLKVIAEDISIIESLEESFITKYRKDLIKIILANSTSDVDKRLELVELINNTQINTL